MSAIWAYPARVTIRGGPPDTDAAPASASAPTAPHAGVSLFYRGARGVVRAALNVFYRTIEVTGAEHLDAGAPTILACNHPNSIIDPLLLALFEERQVCFCARDGLFKIPGFGALLRAVGAVPLMRRSDHAGAIDNAASFAAARAVLVKGGAIAIFPEGKTHERMRIEPLKTGAARIAFDAASEAKGLKIVPVGITYLVRHAFLSDVHVAIGAPIDVASFARDQAGDRAADEGGAGREGAPLSASPSPSVETVRALTGHLEQTMRDLAVHVEEAEDERLIAQVTAIVAGIRAEEGLDEGGQSPAERTALSKRVVKAYHWLNGLEPYETARIRQRIERYMDERRRLGLGGERPTLQHRGESRWALSGWRWVAFLILGAPFALYGLLVSLLPYLLLRVALRLVRPSTDRVALFKLIGGSLSFGICWAAQIAGVAMRFGPLYAALFGASLLPAALLSQRYVTQTRIHRLQLRSADVFFRSQRMALLRAERRALTEILSKLRTRYLDHAGDGPGR